MTELAELLGMRSTGGVFKTLNRLVDIGLLKRVGSRYAPSDAFFGLPLVGPVRAGLPQPADAGQAPELLSVETFLVDRPDQTIYCRVKGDSMVGAGLLDGDIVVVEREAQAKVGDIVVAVVDNEITIKYLRGSFEQQMWWLEPANPGYEAIRPQGSLELLGVVVGSFRRIRR
jgi:SOS-response transcriptional repressor LexA